MSDHVSEGEEELKSEKEDAEMSESKDEEEDLENLDYKKDCATEIKEDENIRRVVENGMISEEDIEAYLEHFEANSLVNKSITQVSF